MSKSVRMDANKDVLTKDSCHTSHCIFPVSFQLFTAFVCGKVGEQAGIAGEAWQKSGKTLGAEEKELMEKRPVTGGGSSLTGAASGASLGLTEAGAAANVSEKVPSSLARWIIKNPVERRTAWVKYLLATVETVLDYFQPEHLNQLRAHAYTVNDLCAWLSRLRSSFVLTGEEILDPEVIHGMCTSDSESLAAPPCGKIAVQATNITMHVCGDSTLNLYPHGKQVGKTLTHSYNYSKMSMKAESGATFPTIVVQANDLLTDDLNMEPASESILVVVWNGNDFAGGKKFEVISELWYTAVANLIELRRF